MSRPSTSAGPSARSTRRSSLTSSSTDARIGVVGATGAVGGVTLRLLAERGYRNVRAFASARSAGRRLGELVVKEATPEVLAAGGRDLCPFSCGAATGRAPVPPALRGG